jgi:hypothetical protein
MVITRPSLLLQSTGQSNGTNCYQAITDSQSNASAPGISYTQQGMRWTTVLQGCLQTTSRPVIHQACYSNTTHHQQLSRGTLPHTKQHFNNSNDHHSTIISNMLSAYTPQLASLTI